MAIGDLVVGLARRGAGVQGSPARIEGVVIEREGSDSYVAHRSGNGATRVSLLSGSNLTVIAPAGTRQARTALDTAVRGMSANTRRANNAGVEAAIAANPISAVSTRAAAAPTASGTGNS